MAKKDSSSDADRLYKEIRRRVTARYEKRKDFWSMNGCFVLFSIIVWGFWLDFFTVSGLLEQGVRLFWFGFLFACVISTVEYVLFELQERAVDREMERVGLRRSYIELAEHRGAKRKNDSGDTPLERLVALSEDGELIPLDDDAPDYRQSRQ
jgi:hypothetical protein